jgi:hypothetical protein
LSSNVVIRLSDRVVKGTTDLADWTEDVSLAEHPISPPIQTDEATERIELDGIKAVFFVKKLAGTSHDELRYHDDLAPLECLWVRATFTDGETIEGIVRNELSFLSGSRFLMAPVDPDSNNNMILVFKSQLVDFQVLGLRKVFEELPDYFKESVGVPAEATAV